MAKTLSMREQVDCLILALESNLKSMQSYAERADQEMSRVGEGSIIYAHCHGMRAGAEYCAEITLRTLDAAKRQRARWEK